MTTIHPDAASQVRAQVPPVAPPARPAMRDQAHSEGVTDPVAGAAVDGSAPAPLPNVTGKVYALKDGSGYVALAIDGHYYKLETAGHGLVYAAAAGVVDASVVDVSRGPVRTMRSPAGQTPSAAGVTDAATAARTAHRLLASDPATALRTHTRVARRNVASLLR